MYFSDTRSLKSGVYFTLMVHLNLHISSALSVATRRVLLHYAGQCRHANWKLRHQTEITASTELPNTRLDISCC